MNHHYHLVVALQKRFELEDFTKFKMLNSPQISPNAETICFMLTTHRLEENDYKTNLWIANRTSGKIIEGSSTSRGRIYHILTCVRTSIIAIFLSGEFVQRVPQIVPERLAGTP